MPLPLAPFLLGHPTVVLGLATTAAVASVQGALGLAQAARW
jgi:hypothetical protein